MKPLIPTFTFLIGASVLLAQNQETTQNDPHKLPEGVLIQKRAPEMSEWMVTPIDSIETLEKPQNQNANTDPNNPKTKLLLFPVTTTKTKNVILRQTTNAKLEQWNTWCINDIQVTLWPDSSKWIVQGITNVQDPTNPNPNYVDYSQTDFPDFSWISAKNFSEIKKVNDKFYIVFKDSLQGLPDSPPTPATAYIDLKTRLPFALQSFDKTYKYEFLIPPNGIQVLPDIVKKLMDQRKLSSSSYKVAPARPY